MRGLDDGGQGFVVDCDQLGCVTRFSGGLRHHNRNRVANMPHSAARDRGVGRQHRGRLITVCHGAQAGNISDPLAREIFSGKDSEDTRGGMRSIGIDSLDDCMRMWRAQHEGVSLAGPGDVVDVVAVTGDETPILDPADRLTDTELLHGTRPLRAHS